MTFTDDPKLHVGVQFMLPILQRLPKTPGADIAGTVKEADAGSQVSLQRDSRPVASAASEVLRECVPTCASSNQATGCLQCLILR